MNEKDKFIHKIRLFLIVFLVIVCIQNNFTVNVNADTISNSNNVEDAVNTKTYTVANNIVFKGVFSSNNMYFKIDKWWRVNFVEVQINFSINQLVDKDKDAYICLSTNSTPFYSQKVYYNKNSEIQTINIKIPKNILINGTNEFKFECYSRVSDLPCVDDVNLANWITIKDNSNIKVNFNNIVSDNRISNFPYPYIKENDEKNIKTSIIIPNEYSDNELSAALILNSHFGKEYSDGDYGGKIVKYSDFSKDSETNGVYIGNYSSMPQEFNIEHNNNEDCTVKVINSPYSKNANTKIMIIVCDNNENLIKGVKALTNKDILLQLNSNLFSIDKNLKEETKIVDENSEITFKDMGLNEIYLKGSFRRSANVNYSLPKNRMLSKGDKIKIFMRYSENLDFDKSLVTIYMNGTPIGSKKLEKEMAKKDELEIVIPEDVKNTNYIELNIAFDLEIPNSYCEKRQEEMPWALVTDNSYIYTGLNNINDYYFSNYGAPFVKNRFYNDTLMVVPDNLNYEDLNAIGSIFSYLGKEVEYNNGNLRAIRNSNLKNEEKESNLIVYGTPENNDFIKKLNDNLWFKYDKSYSKFLSNEKLFLTDPYSSEIATFQLDISPFNSQKAILILTSPKEGILRDSLKYVYSSKEILKLNGDSAIIDEYGNVKTYKMKNETSKPIYNKIESLNNEAKGLLGIMILIVIFVLVSGVLYYLKNKTIHKKQKK